MKVSRFFQAAVEMLERRPWLPGAVFLAPLLLSLLLAVLLLANICDSSFRFLPDYPDRLIVFLDYCVIYLWFFTPPVLAIVMFILPVAMLCSARCRFTGLKMLLASFCALWAGMLLWMAIWLVALFSLDQTVIARENLERKAEAERMGKTDYVRKKIPHMHQRDWMYGNRRYRIRLESTDPDRYSLTDLYWRYNIWWKEAESRLLLEGIVRWENRKGGLFLETARGKCYELDFESGRLKKCTSKNKGEDGK